jgi:aspartyl-tRNA(Asn)/glutamyl-tRNA(Gln) amidotransferase subunit C
MRMAITRDDVHHVALLARLELTEGEEAELAEQLGRILGFFEVLEKLDTAGVEPTAHVAPIDTPFRDDRVTNSPQAERWLANAPAADGKHFRVPKIIE